MTIKTRVYRSTLKAQFAVLNTYYTAKYNLEEKKASKKAAAYEAQIQASQAKLAETTLVPGYTKIYA